MSEAELRAPVALVVDDSPVMRLVQRTLLAELAGVEVIEATDGVAALEAMAERDYQVDLVLLDWAMPRLDGVALARCLKQTPNTKGIALLMLTTATDAPRLQQAAKVGVDGYLLKPFTDEMLFARLSTLGTRGPMFVPGTSDDGGESERPAGFLARLPASLSASLLDLGSSRELADETVLAGAGQRVEALTLLLEGRIEVDGGPPHVAGEAVAVAELLTGDPCPARYVARGATRIHRVPRSDFEALAEANPRLAIELCRAHVERARRLWRPAPRYPSLAALLQELHLQQRTTSVALADGARLELQQGEIVIARHPEVAADSGLTAFERITAATGPLESSDFRLGPLSDGGELNLPVRTVALLRDLSKANA